MLQSFRVSNQDKVFASKLWTFLYYYLNVKQITIQFSHYQSVSKDIIQQAGTDINWCTLAYQLNYQELKLRFHLQVLVSPAPLSSSTVVTIHMTFIKKIVISAPSLADKLAVNYTNLINALKTFYIDLTNPILLDFWGYVYRFGHQLEGLIVFIAHFDPLKRWQISFYQTL